MYDNACHLSEYSTPPSIVSPLVIINWHTKKKNRQDRVEQRTCFFQHDSFCLRRFSPFQSYLCIVFLLRELSLYSRQKTERVSAGANERVCQKNIRDLQALIIATFQVPSFHVLQPPLPGTPTPLSQVLQCQYNIYSSPSRVLQPLANPSLVI